MSETDEHEVAEATRLHSEGACGGSGDIHHGGKEPPSSSQQKEALERLRYMCHDRPNEGRSYQDRDVGLGYGAIPRMYADDIHNEAAQNKRPRVMPDQFDGKASWTDFLAHFEICSEINGWNL